MSRVSKMSQLSSSSTNLLLLLIYSQEMALKQHTIDRIIRYLILGFHSRFSSNIPKEEYFFKKFLKPSTSLDIRNNKLSCYLCTICSSLVSAGNPQEKPHLRTYSPQQNHVVGKVKITTEAWCSWNTFEI